MYLFTSLPLDSSILHSITTAKLLGDCYCVMSCTPPNRGILSPRIFSQRIRVY